MAVILIGEVVNSCDTDNFTPGDIGDGDIVAKQGTQYIGLKNSNGTDTFITSTLGATAPYDFSVGGGEEGYHIIMFFISLTAVNTTSGFRLYLGDTVGSDNGFFNIAPPDLYSGGWISRVVDPTNDFSGATGFTTTGNPAQLTNVNEIGGGFTTITMIAGNFQNCCIDQITIGLGLRVDAGTVGTPNTFETLRAADEGTSSNIYGWISSLAGTIVIKGGVFIGPETGTATSVFNDSNRVILFADEPVADNFYTIDIRGTNTDVDFTSCILRTEDAAGNPNTKWNLTLDGTSIPTFNDNGSLFQGFDTITLRSGSTLDGTSLDGGDSLIQNNATLTNCSVLNANTADGVAFITSNNPQAISNCSFTFSDGHAIEITTPGTYSFDGNSFTGYGADGTNDAAIYNNSGGAVTLNISNATSPTIRNGAGSTTSVVQTVNLTVTGIEENSEIRIFEAGTITELDGSENVTTGSFIYSYDGADIGNDVDIRIFNLEYQPLNFIQSQGTAITLAAQDSSLPVQQIFDRNYENP